METVFSRILNMSLTGSAVILCVLLARLALRKAPKKFSYALWAVVLFRLLCPVSLPSPVSLLELAKPQVSQSQGMTSSVSYQAVEYVYPQAEVDLPEFSPQENTPSEEAPQKASLSPMTVAAWVWLAGVGGLALYSGIGYLRLRRKLVGAVPYRGNAYLADHIGTPFVLGVLFPKIYIPFSVPHGERHYILAHERCHIRRGDPVWKLLAYAALCIHWFNPLVWAAFLLAEKDMEMSCDEAVIRKLEPNDRADYASALLRLSTGGKVFSGVAFGEGNTKGRILNMAKWKQPKVWVTALCIVLCVVVLVVCGLNPRKGEDSNTPFVIHDLPKAYSYNTDKDGNITFTAGNTVVGGIMGYPLPENYDPEDNHYDWLQEAGISDYGDNALVYTGGMTNFGGGWRANFESDVPAGESPSVERSHIFYVLEDTVYDFWLDAKLLALETRYAIEDAVTFWKPEKIGIGDLYLTLPEGYVMEATVEQTSSTTLYNQNFTDGTNVIGGIQVWDTPSFSLDNGYDGETYQANNYAQWVQALGLPEAQGTMVISGMIEDTLYGDLEAEYWKAEDLKEYNVIHYFYIGGAVVYDVWFDQNLISQNEIYPIMKSVELQVSNSGNQIRFGELSFKLPQSYTYKPAAVSQDVQLNGELTDGTNVIGGVTLYPVENTQTLIGLDWVHSLDLPEWEDETLGYFGGGSIYGDYEFEFFSDVPEGVERTVLRKHTFFIGEDGIYDLWFDELTVDNGTIDEILRTVGLGEEAAQTQSPETVPVPFQIGNLPDGYSYTAEADGSIRFTDGANTVGGVIGYLIPEGVYDPYDGIFLWLEDVGIPDFEDTSLAYMGGISDFQGGWSAEFASDVPEGVEPTVHRRHTFTVVGDRVYDAWFDMTLLDYNTQQELKDSVQFLTVENTESAVTQETISAEDLAYEKCRAVMDAVQSGSYHIVTEFQYDNNPTNNFSMEYYSSDELGWLRIITNSLSERHAALQANGQEFTNIGNWSADELIWTEGESANNFEPWLASIYFIKRNFTYIDTLTDADGVCCMLRMDVYFADAEGYDPYYFVNFYFDPDGNFQKVQLQVNLFQDNAFTVTESIVSLDDESIAAKINEEYQRAIAP